MKSARARVLVASEHSKGRMLLREVAKEGGVVVAEAESALQAVKLAKDLKPDVALVDFGLPYRRGLPDIPFSRINGLEAGRAMREVAPEVKVVVVTGLRHEALREGTRWRSAAYLAVDSVPNAQPLGIRALAGGDRQELVIASVAPLQASTLGDRIAAMSLRGLGCGAVLLVSGVLLLPTGALAPAGIVVGAVGAAGVVAGTLGMGLSLLAPGPSRSTGDMARASLKS